MTAIDPFTTPAEAEREARVKQAHALLDRAQDASTRTINYNDGVVQHGESVAALRDALVGQGHALLSVRDELADIAGSLRKLTALPGAVQWVGDHLSALDDTVGGGLAELTEAIHKHGNSVDDSSSAIVDAIRAHGEVLDSAVFGAVDVMDRPRWWQWRRRRTLWRLSKSLDNVTSAPDAAESTPEEFRVDLLQQPEDPWDAAGRNRRPLPSRQFRAEEERTPWEIAQQILPDLCNQAGIPANPSQVQGQLYACDRDGAALWFIDTVFLPDATVLDAPAGGF